MRGETSKTVRILGTHGVPARYGGFETAAEHIARHLVARGWRVVVYCQAEGRGPIRYAAWEGIEQVVIPVPGDGWRGTSRFDLLSVLHACRHRDLCLTFGYNTAALNLLQRLRGIPNVINMDGIEWSRAKWGRVLKGILYANEHVARRVGNHLVADHPEIAKYLESPATRGRLTTIAYGAESVEHAPEHVPEAYGLVPGGYFSLIARPVPENSILELIAGFSSAPRHAQLLVLGHYHPDTDPYHRAVLEAASDEVVFAGAVYDPALVSALRFHSLAYLHGHTVGGTNPSLVEALGAGNAVIAHDNRYNRWVAQDAALYFRDAAGVAKSVEELLDSASLTKQLQLAARARHRAEFTWQRIAGQYEELLTSLLPR